MIKLKLRDEFLGSHMPGTAISLRNSDNTGAVQQSPNRILEITYPTADVQTALKQLSTQRAQKPIVLMGDRGRGKSHIMAVMHHAVESAETVQQWAREWGNKVDVPLLKDIELLRGFRAISEPVHNHEYPLLWNLLFDRHPRGEFYRGKFQQMNQPYPPKSLLMDMFKDQPTVLILDEFQKWFDGLNDEKGKQGNKWWTWASNFTQNLSEISEENPDKLIIVISVLDNQTEAFRQVHRNHPVVVDFRGPTAKHDRLKMVLHRLFENRNNIPENDIQNITSVYASERFRLRFSNLPETEKPQKIAEVIHSWPFSPELMQLLEEHILMAEAAQEARDLIRILAQAYRARGENAPLMTPADFLVDEDSGGVQSLLDSIATAGAQEKLREIAQSNLELVTASGEQIPHAQELVSALWMRSMSPSRTNGGTRHELHLDITRDAVIDDNSFNAEISALVDNSKNIHGEETPQGKLRFDINENPRSLVRATAKNDRLWQSGSQVTGQTTYPEADIQHIRDTIRHILVPEAKEPTSRVIVLGPNWENNPWTELDDRDKPQNWDRPVTMAIPVSIKDVATGRIPILGKWLVENVPVKRNTIRFLLISNSEGIFKDGELRFLARCSYLTSVAWKDDPKYLALKRDFDTPLRALLKERFDRFAILRNWNYQKPEECNFDVERITVKGIEIPDFVENKIKSDLFDPAEFAGLILRYAQQSKTVGEILDELSEPPATPDKEAVVYLGAMQIYEEILKIAAKGKVILNVNGDWVGRQPDHQDDDAAYHFIRARAFRTGQELRNIQLGLPGATGGFTVSGPKTQAQPQPPTGPVPVPQPPTGGPGTTTGGGTGGTLWPTSPNIKVNRTDQPTTGINLIGSFEKWGISGTQELSSAKIEFNNITVQQIKQILQRVPSAFRASMEIAYNEEQEHKK
jgi:hypothetical protein